MNHRMDRSAPLPRWVLSSILCPRIITLPWLWVKLVCLFNLCIFTPFIWKLHRKILLPCRGSFGYFHNKKPLSLHYLARSLDGSRIASVFDRVRITLSSLLNGLYSCPLVRTGLGSICLLQRRRKVFLPQRRLRHRPSCVQRRWCDSTSDSGGVHSRRRRRDGFLRRQPRRRIQFAGVRGPTRQARLSIHELPRRYQCPVPRWAVDKEQGRWDHRVQKRVFGI